MAGPGGAERVTLFTPHETGGDLVAGGEAVGTSLVSAV